MRNLLLFFLLLLVIHFVRRWLQRAEEPEDRARTQREPAEAERVLACAHCGLLVPESEVVREGGLEFCSAEHARLGPQRGH